MSTVALTKDTFEDTITRPGITLVDWWASWCGPCRMFAPIFQAASEQHPDITFGAARRRGRAAHPGCPRPGHGQGPRRPRATAARSSVAMSYGTSALAALTS
jgi:hypothetical protein